MAQEKKIEDYLTKNVERIGGMCVKFPPIFFAGFPDRIVLVPKGIIVFVELKAPNGVASPLQLIVHKRLRKIGFRVEIINSKEEVDGFVLTL